MFASAAVPRMRECPEQGPGILIFPTRTPTRVTKANVLFHLTKPKYGCYVGKWAALGRGATAPEIEDPHGCAVLGWVTTAGGKWVIRGIESRAQSLCTYVVWRTYDHKNCTSSTQHSHYHSVRMLTMIHTRCGQYAVDEIHRSRFASTLPIAPVGFGIGSPVFPTSQRRSPKLDRLVACAVARTLSCRFLLIRKRQLCLSDL